jgi:hypothetical protein
MSFTSRFAQGRPFQSSLLSTLFAEYSNPPRWDPIFTVANRVVVIFALIYLFGLCRALGALRVTQVFVQRNEIVGRCHHFRFTPLQNHDEPSGQEQCTPMR